MAIPSRLFTNAVMPYNMQFVQITLLKTNMTPQESLKKAIALCDGQVEFAALLTKVINLKGNPRIISQQIVSYWTRSPFGIPSEFCIDVEELPKVNFQITKHQLRPDIFGATPYQPIE